MPGWHTRLWRRVKIAPGVSINFSKSGPSVSVGPRGAKITVGRRGMRQTVGIPGTGIYATRQLSKAPGERTTPPEPGAAPASDAAPVAGAPAAASSEPAYGLAIAAGVIFGVALALIGLPSSQAVLGGGTAVVAGIVYEGLAHHHPGPAKLLVQIVVGFATVVVGLIGLVALAALAGGLATSTRSGRRRRGG
jgi:hypothetical protein